MTTKRHPDLLTLSIGTAIMLVAILTRVIALGSAPPGLQHDEIFKAQEGIALIESGDFRLFYPTNQGHEGAFVWLLGIAYALVGQNVLMVKLPAMVCGLLTVALLYRVTGEIFNRRVAFVAAGIAAVWFWTVFTSRVGLRAIMLPVFALLVIWGLHRLSMMRAPSWRVALGVGLALGMAIYTYTASFALFIAFGGYVVALAFIDRAAFRRQWRQLVLVGVVGITLPLPMLNIRLNDPQGQNRVSTITRPLNDFLDGRPGELLGNAARLAGMAAFTGDPEWRYNIAGRPLFVLPVGLLVYAGGLIAVWRSRQKPILVFYGVLLLAGMIPSLLTVSAPSFLRSMLMIPVVLLFIGLAIDLIPFRRGVWLAGTLAISVTALADLPAYFTQWVANEEVHTIYRDDIRQLAQHLRDQGDVLALVSTSDVNLDPKIYPYYRQNESAQVVFFDGRTNVVLSDTDNARLFISPESPISPPHAGWLSQQVGARAQAPVMRGNGTIAYEVYSLTGIAQALDAHLHDVAQTPVYVYPETRFPPGDVADWAEPLAYPVSFGGLIELVGVDLPRRQIASRFDGVNIQLYLRPLVDDADLPLSVFVHMSRRNGAVHAQRDLLGVPSRHWRPGILIIQDNFVIAGETRPGNYIITMGIYNYQTGERLPVVTPDGRVIGDRVVIDRVRVTEAE